MTAEAENLLTVGDDLAVTVRLLQSLLPAPHTFFYYDLTPACVWSSSGAEDFELDFELAGLPSDQLSASGPDTLSRTLPSGRRALLLFLRGISDEREGVLVSLCAGDAAAATLCSESHPDILAPAARMLGECLRLRQQARDERGRANEAEQELKFAYRIDEKIHGTSRSH
ncbi:MAG: hypothetical protein WD448_13375, partial [Woeseia sp.]